MAYGSALLGKRGARAEVEESEGWPGLPMPWSSSCRRCTIPSNDGSNNPEFAVSWQSALRQLHAKQAHHGHLVMYFYFLIGLRYMPAMSEQINGSYFSWTASMHNRNDMTNLFRASNWVSSSNDSIVSRGTTCAGMTAHTVLLAQTKVGFLTGGRKKSFRLLSEDEQRVQLEEAYARATVAITRARSLCLIMGSLDMKGLLGAATVMGTLMYGARHVWEGEARFYLHDGELSGSPPDETFIHMLQQNCCLTGPHFPPGNCGGTARLQFFSWRLAFCRPCRALQWKKHPSQHLSAKLCGQNSGATFGSVSWPQKWARPES